MTREKNPRETQGLPSNRILSETNGTDKEHDWVVYLVPFALFALVPVVQMLVS